MTESTIGGDGAVDLTFADTLQNALDELIGDLSAIGLVPVVLHGADSPLTTPIEIISFVLQSPVATQRRRQRR